MVNLLLQISWEGIRTRSGTEKLSDILWFAGIVIATLLLKRPLSQLTARLSSGIANRFSDKRHGKVFRELTVKPFELLLEVLLYYLAANQLTILQSFVIFHRQHGKRLTEIRVSDLTDMIFSFLIILFFTLFIARVAEFVFYILIGKANERHDRDKEQLLPIVKEVIKILVWVTGVFWIMGSVFHVNIPALITGLGIGGVAIALAAKESVENFLAAFIILTDKPFRTGELIKLGNLEGHVERIGFRSTRLRNAEGSLFIIPNKKLIGENLENLTQRDSRRVRVLVHLPYGLQPPELQRMMEELKSTIRQTPHVTEPVDVTFEGFGENAFQLNISYHLPEPVPEGAGLAAIKQEISMNVYGLVTKYAGKLAASASPAQNEWDDRSMESETTEKKEEDE